MEWWSLEAAGRSWVNGRKFLLCNKVVLLGANRLVVSPHLQEMSSSEYMKTQSQLSYTHKPLIKFHVQTSHSKI